MVLSDHHAFEHLNALFVPFDDLGVNAHGIAGTKTGHLRPVLYRDALELRALPLFSFGLAPLVLAVGPYLAGARQLFPLDLTYRLWSECHPFPLLCRGLYRKRA